jgi:predicted transposase
MQTLKVKLETTPEQAQALLKTMHQFNAACNFVAEKAFELHTANKIELQKVVYHQIREQFDISAQMAVRAISKAAEAYKRDKSIKPEFESDGAVIYDQRIMSWKGISQYAHRSEIPPRFSVTISVLQGGVVDSSTSTRTSADLFLVPFTAISV